MDNLEKTPRASWLRPRLRTYRLPQRPNSWAPGSFRKLTQNEDVSSQPQSEAQQSRPPAPPVRSPFTRLQTVSSLPHMDPQGIKNNSDQRMSGGSFETTAKVNGDNDIETDSRENGKSWNGSSPTEDKNYSMVI